MIYNSKDILQKYILLIYGLLKKDSWNSLSNCDVLLVRHDNDCGYNFLGKVYSPLIDTIGDLCIMRGLKVQSVATPYSRYVGNEAHFSPVSLNRSFFMIGVAGKLLQLFREYEYRKKWTELRRVELWFQILNKANPKYVIGIQPDEFLCRAAKLHGISVYDLQHGIIHDENPYYGEHYRENTSVESLPDGFLCWDDRSVSVILKWAHRTKIQVLKIGNPWFLRFSRILKEDSLVIEAMADKEVISIKQPCILVSLQWGFSENYPDESNGIIFEALEKAILDTSDLYDWILRLHPVQLRGSERGKVIDYLDKTFGTEKTQKWLKYSYMPLPALLNKVDLHITGGSTVVIEAAWMGVQSGLMNERLTYDPKYQDIYSNERNTGMVENLPHNSEEIKVWIAENLAKGHGKATMNDSGCNLDSFINTILEECTHEKVVSSSYN